jgi:hypothetical protein
LVVEQINITLGKGNDEMTTKTERLAGIEKLSLSFGVEIECYAPSDDANRNFESSYDFAQSTLENAGLYAVNTGYTHRVTEYWKVVSDASLGRNGVEIVSPILYGESGMADLKKAVTAMKEAGFTVNTTTGTHVHFGIADQPLKQIKAFAKFYMRYEHIVDWMVGKSRRGNSNGMLKSHSNGQKWTMDSRFRDVNQARTVRDIASACSYGDRYYKLNFAAYSRQTTMEVRHFGGSLNATKIENWILLLDAMWRSCAIHTVGSLTKDVSKPAENAYSFFKTTLDHEPVLAEYWHNRVKANLAAERRSSAAARRVAARARRSEERRQERQRAATQRLLERQAQIDREARTQRRTMDSAGVERTDYSINDNGSVVWNS